MSYFISNVAGVCSGFQADDELVYYVLTGGAIFVQCEVVSCTINIVKSSGRWNGMIELKDGMEWLYDMECNVEW